MIIGEMPLPEGPLDEALGRIEWPTAVRGCALIQEVLHEAADRGEIDHAVISDELWDLLPGYLIFRSIMPNRPPTAHTVQALVDDVIIPSLTRKANG